MYNRRVQRWNPSSYRPAAYLKQQYDALRPASSPPILIPWSELGKYHDAATLDDAPKKMGYCRLLTTAWNLNGPSYDLAADA